MTPHDDGARWVPDPRGPYIGDFRSGRYEGVSSLDDDQIDVVTGEGWQRFRVEPRLGADETPTPAPH